MPGSLDRAEARTASSRGSLEVLEAAALTAALTLLAALAVRIGWGLAAVDVLVVGTAAALGYTIADFFTGFAHWFCDRFFEEDTRVIGPVLIQPFREHHRDPLAMTRHGLLELTGNSAMALAPLLAVAWWWLPPSPGPGARFALTTLVTFALAALLTNLFHRWAHAAPHVARPIARLQAWGLILPPAHHARHHEPPHLGGYCVTTGWVNRWADAIGLFRALERIGHALGLPAARQP